MAFQNCSGLTWVTVDKGNTKYKSAGNCIIDTTTNTLILGCKDSIIPTDGSVTSIGDWAFYQCSGLTSITIPNSVTSIGERAFYGCSGLTGVTIGSGVTSIGEWAFDDCSGLTSITVDTNNTTYASHQGILMNKAKTAIILVPKAIKGDIVLPNNVTSIGNSAFDGCSGLISITI
ncbi:MAG: leucine-rich repeat domain-containing protein, partial [Clostridia bacterium]